MRDGRYLTGMVRRGPLVVREKRVFGNSWPEVDERRISWPNGAIAHIKSGLLNGPFHVDAK
jgi:hypothetical protein